jgi:hypothetical protein
MDEVVGGSAALQGDTGRAFDRFVAAVVAALGAADGGVRGALVACIRWAGVDK